MTVVRTFETRAEALAAAAQLIEFGLEARVTTQSDGHFAVTLAAGSRSVALDILDHGSPRFGRTVAWARARRAPRLTTGQFGAVAAGAVALFLLWMGLTDAYGAPVVIVTVAAVVIIGGGLWLVTPEAFETEEVRPIAAEVVAIGILLALAPRVVFDVVRLPAGPYRTYPMWLWIAAAAIPTGIFVVLVGRLVRARGIHRIRRTMTLFGGAGLAYATTAGATHVLDLGFTAGRWGLVPVWAVLGIYPVLAIPFHVFAAGILGWGWASGGRRFAISVAGVAIGLGLFHHAVVRSPFWGPLVVLGFALWWVVLFVRNAQNEPIPWAVPERLLRGPGG